MPTIHLWGYNDKPSLISPDSIALFWLINLFNIECTVVFSNNVDLSPNKELPVLIKDDGSAICKFDSIVESLWSRNASLLERGLFVFTSERLNRLTDYQLYLNKINYESYTRKVFSHLLYWPMWYNTPLNNRALAKQKCASIGYIEPDTRDEQVGPVDEATKHLARDSKTFQMTQERRQKDKEMLEYTKYNMQYTSQLQEVLKSLLDARKNIPDQLIPADLLLYANLYVQLELPDGERIQTFLQHQFPDFMRSLLETCNKYSHLAVAGNVILREPTFSESGNLLMTTYNFTRNII
ncbi:HDR148Cp [Eremothecium sinecaudum]|uniref:HDR148Cp n=1 Tax=Eremothecium sinecaudum TaxID=45286 RepID=A0A0X8HSX8_9SACH|nr:HDR148Cp [Eremothecium sinecaudum]AMD20890.1 HDR148Cp [Eremothecium sinecaudum]